MKVIKREQEQEQDAISLDPSMDRKAIWITIHGKTQKDNRVSLLSLDEAKVLADALVHQALELERKANRPITP